MSDKTKSLVGISIAILVVVVYVVVAGQVKSLEREAYIDGYSTGVLSCVSTE
ncbi:MAG: hypothetical protein ABII39_00350 [Candidatus Micrarchaeota archaeon]